VVQSDAAQDRTSMQIDSTVIKTKILVRPRHALRPPRCYNAWAWVLNRDGSVGIRV